MRRTVPAACLLAVLAAAGCSKIGGTGDLNYVGGDGSVVEVKAADRGAPVDVSGTTLQGKPLDLSSDRGKVVVVNVWWSGCVPCRTEMPMLVDVEHSYAKGRSEGKVAFVGIDIRESDPKNGVAFERDRGVDYPSFSDQASKTLLAFGKYDPPATPATLVLDQQGRVAAMINGPIPSKDTLTSVVDGVLGSAGD